MNLRTLDEKIHAYCCENLISGTLRITHRDERVYERHFGYAVDNGSVNFSSDTRFTLYSLSKPFCAIGIMKLWERGAVNLSAHPSQYVPEAAGLDSRVTVDHLLHHTSGLPDFEQNRDFKDKYAPGTPNKIREHLSLIASYPTYFDPGCDGKYENINFAICALVIENVTDKPYAEYMRNEVLLPLGAADAIIDHGSATIPNAAQGYELVSGKRTPVPKNYDWMFGAGDIVGTVDDVYRLNVAMKRKRLLKSETWEKIMTPSPINNMGMGLTVIDKCGKSAIRHNGGSRGFRTLHIWIPEDDFDIILLTNSGYGNARDDIADMIFSEFYGVSDGKTSPAMDAGYI